MRRLPLYLLTFGVGWLTGWLCAALAHAYAMRKTERLGEPQP